MVLDLVIIGLAINAGPLHNSAFILLLSAPRGVRKGLAFVLAWLGCLVLVLAAVILLTGGKPPAPRSAPSTAALALKLALGIGMVVYAERKRRRGSRPRRSPKWLSRLDNASPWTAAGLGVVLQPWGLVAAGAATVVQAHLSSIGSYVALFVFCLLATSGLLAMLLYATFRPAAARARLGALRDWTESHQDQAIVTLSLLAGLWLVAKSLYQLV
ncbi:GAP family protein [Streptomyces sp. OR43]|uniref:GAP family protein n=1 Tax=Streptomyces sp. or43 TaxID=2478957 RepID=UPI0011CE2225|nr:GAP family protein [Streptomyces sp. or43]TXS43758.1 GAP family protein [Streptomyces sp. or43]